MKRNFALPFAMSHFGALNPARALALLRQPARLNEVAREAIPATSQTSIHDAFVGDGSHLYGDYGDYHLPDELGSHSVPMKGGEAICLFAGSPFKPTGIFKRVLGVRKDLTGDVYADVFKQAGMVFSLAQAGMIMRYPRFHGLLDFEGYRHGMPILTPSGKLLMLNFWRNNQVWMHRFSVFAQGRGSAPGYRYLFRQPR